MTSPISMAAHAPSRCRIVPEGNARRQRDNPGVTETEPSRAATAARGREAETEGLLAGPSVSLGVAALPLHANRCREEGRSDCPSWVITRAGFRRENQRRAVGTHVQVSAVGGIAASPLRLSSYGLAASSAARPAAKVGPERKSEPRPQGRGDRSPHVVRGAENRPGQQPPRTRDAAILTHRRTRRSTERLTTHARSFILPTERYESPS